MIPLYLAFTSTFLDGEVGKKETASIDRVGVQDRWGIVLKQKREIHS